MAITDESLQPRTCKVLHSKQSVPSSLLSVNYTKAMTANRRWIAAINLNMHTTKSVLMVAYYAGGIICSATLHSCRQLFGSAGISCVALWDGVAPYLSRLFVSEAC